MTTESHTFQIRDYHPLWYFFPEISLIYAFCNSALLKRGVTALQPLAYCIATAHSVWASLGSLAATTRILVLVYFPPGTKMFQFPGCAPLH